MRTVTIAKVALVATITSIALSVSALSMMPANLGQIVQYTEKAFEGKAISTEKIKLGNGWVDKITMQVTDPIMGDVHAGDQVSWNQTRNGEDIPFAGMPKYSPGQSYVIFLPAKAPGSNLQAPVAMGQGTFQIHVNTETGAKVARNEFQNASLFQNVDTQQLSLAIATEGTSGSRSAVTPQRSAEVQSKLASGPGGALDLQTLKNAAKAFKSEPVPAKAFESKSAQTPLKVEIQK